MCQRQMQWRGASTTQMAHIDVGTVLEKPRNRFGVQTARRSVQAGRREQTGARVDIAAELWKQSSQSLHSLRTHC